MAFLLVAPQLQFLCELCLVPWFNDLSSLAGMLIAIVTLWPCFSRMHSKGSRFTLGVWGSGGEAVFAKSCTMLSTVRNRLREDRKALLMRDCIWSGAESVSSWLVTPQLYWRCRCLCEWPVAPQLYWRLQRRWWRCLCEWPVAPQWFWHLQTRCLCVKSECPTKGSSKSVLQECQVRVLYKSVKQECPVRVPYKRVKKACQARVSHKSVKYECLTRRSCRSVKMCQVRVSYKRVKQECQVRVSYKSVK